MSHSSLFSGCPPGSDSVVELVLGDERSTHCVVPKHKAKTEWDFTQEIFSSFATLFLVLALLSIGAHILTKWLRYRYFKEFGRAGQPSISINNTTGGGTTELTPLLPDSVIRDTTIENFLDEMAREKPIRFTAQQLNGYTQRQSAELGKGGFGAVYKGMLPNGLDIAVKVLHEHMDDEVTEQQFMAEVGTLWRTNHANLIKLMGYCFDADERALVYELMPNGSLDRYLFDRRRRMVVGPSELLAIAVGIARGLRYLHEECQKKIIHYDVKASNVLLDKTLTPKLMDFGVAQLVTRVDLGGAHASVSLHAGRGTPGYIAAEVIHVRKAPITEKCDVYSFGMLLFELIGRRKNMDNNAPESHKFLPLLAWAMCEQGTLLELVKERHYPVAAEDEELWKETAERMCKLAFLCVQEQPEERPTMSMAVNMLEGHMEIPPPVYPFGWMYYSQTQEASGTTSSSRATTSEVIVMIDDDTKSIHLL